MKKRCTARFVNDVYSRTHSWRKTAKELNDLYQVNLDFLTWRGYAVGRRDITDPKVRAALLLNPRVCPVCRNRSTTEFSRLLERLTLAEWQLWRKLRRQKKYQAANDLLDEVYSR